ncbi:peptidoglycan/xylan/chitin deacetylase (PgdA/CDA1 family) [Cerasibacillus quisquiliarum]|uniref:Polysaccharide deacetylase n=1 Tax=Cerasibacillus quisquiliarum TaxID=227865 RepID=A0A511UUL4_9BACI|nr:polysaccharide deacetylase family protein [Cerasibacillus quisquiliarum]MBB5145725.1 peptidoglycan/xylan/chitin deacetylase (PgdA/CDA1 family) [Cerasibacillus quisquiliarum]GEN30296.1 polysaccharide deacetylase [Cerasibacillus quisquiliarum]
MRKIISYICLYLLLIGCQSEINLDEKHESVKYNHSPSEQQSKQTKQNQEEKNKSVERDAEEAVQATHRVDEHNWYIRPLNEQENEQVVLLTIDDAPDQFALEMAHILKEKNAGAIFFVNGHFLETKEQKEILKQIHQMGFVIGNHTYSHAYLPDISEEKQKEEIIRVNDLVEDITGERPAFFRAPFGANTDYSEQIIAEENMKMMNWSYGYDFQPEYMDKDRLTKIMLETELLHNGANILMHDRKWTKEALEDIVIGLREKGYEILDPHYLEVE